MWATYFVAIQLIDATLFAIRANLQSGKIILKNVSQLYTNKRFTEDGK